MASANSVDYVVIALYALLMVRGGFYVLRFNRGAAEYFRVGSRIPWLVAGLSCFMAGFSAWTFTGAAGVAYRSGIAVIGLYIGNALSFLLGYFIFAKRWRRSRITTVMEYLSGRFNPTTHQVFSWTTIVFQLFTSASTLFGLSLFVSSACGFPVTWTILGAGALIVFYCVLGALFDFYEDSFDTTPGIQSVNYQRSGDKTAAFAEPWIGEHAGKPFFFLFHIYEPHVPYDPPEPFRSQYGLTYDGEVATADAIVGQFLDTLRTLGVYDRAIVIVTADHGEGLGEHGEQQHSIFLYREAIKVPLLLKLPGSSGAGRRVAAPVQLSDILPTVTAALGLPTPKDVSGTSLFEAGATGAAGRVIYGETLFPRLQLGWSDLHSALDARYHYIHGPRPELYDMVADPREEHDLAKSDPGTVSRLARELLRFPTGSAKPTNVDQETMRRLSSLGYLGTLRDIGSGAKSLNPADNLPALRRMEEAWHLASEGQVPRAIEVLRSSRSEE